MRRSLGTGAVLDSVCHSRPFWLFTKHTSILPRWLNGTHPGLRKTTPVSCSRLQCSFGVRCLLGADVASVLQLLLESQPSCPGHRPNTPWPERTRRDLTPQPAWVTKGFPGRALVQVLCLTAADPGLSSSSWTSVASVLGQFKPSLEVGKNAFNPIL